MSALLPLPGEVGFCRVISMTVQPSPLVPQWPVYPCRGHWHDCKVCGIKRSTHPSAGNCTENGHKQGLGKRREKVDIRDSTNQRTIRMIIFAHG